MKDVNRNVQRVLDLSIKLLYIADRGDLQREDDSCGVLYGIVRDCAYKMMDAAKKEQLRHIQHGIWDENTDKDSL